MAPTVQDPPKFSIPPTRLQQRTASVPSSFSPGERWVIYSSGMSAVSTEQRKETAFFWRDSDLPFEARQAFDSSACYRAHTHPTFSVGIVDEGESLLSVPGRQLKITRGDVVMIWPGEVHACNPLPSSRWSYRMFYLDWDWVQSIGPGGRNLAKAPGIERLMRTKETAGVIDRMGAAVLQQASPAEKRAQMGQCVADLYHLATQSNSTCVTPTPRPQSIAVHRARDYIEAHASETIDLRKLAKEVGLTHFQLIRKFGRKVGLTPHAYQLDQRVVQARELLKSSRSQAEVAYALGFADQSHFQRVFKRRVAATPGQYREGNRR